MLLEEVRGLLAEAGFRVGNVDATIVADKPKMSPHIHRDGHEHRLGNQGGPVAVNVKATTTEGLGFAGRGDGMAAYAVALIRKGE